jgi:hypothetical protein
MVLAIERVAPHARIICAPLHLIIHHTCSQHTPCNSLVCITTVALLSISAPAASVCCYLKVAAPSSRFMGYIEPPCQGEVHRRS